MEGISLVKLLKKAESAGVTFSLDNGELVFTLKAGIKTISKDLLSEFKTYKNEIKAFLNSDLYLNTISGGSSIRIERFGAPQQHVPLSFSQQRLWFIDKLQGSVEYNLYSVLKVTGRMDSNALQYAIKCMVERHEVLRTIYVDRDGKAQQKLLPMDDLTFHYETFDLSSNATISDFISELIEIPFDLSTGPLVKVFNLQITNNECQLIFMLHHIAFDGWSENIFFKELSEFYRSKKNHQQTNILPLAIQYSDYCLWQRKFLDSSAFKKQLKYWVDLLKDAPPLNLPLDFPRPAIQSRKGNVLTTKIQRITANRIQNFASKSGTTPFMLFLTTVNVLLYRYTQQHDVCIGVPVAGRNLEECQSLIGLFVNTVVIRSKIKDDSVEKTHTFNSLLQQVKISTLEAYTNQDVPFERIVDQIEVARDMSKTPLFQVMFTMHAQEQNNLHLDDEVVIEEQDIVNKWSKFDLTFNVQQCADGWQISIEYCSELFEQATITRMLSHFEMLLYSSLESPEQEICHLQMIDKEEESKLLIEFNNSSQNHPRYTSVVDTLENRALQHPLKTAVRYANSLLSYEQLHNTANELANYLIKRGVKKNTLVAICIERSLELHISMLAVMKAGGTYVPLDPSYPLTRLSFVLDDSNSQYLITGKGVTSFVDTSNISELITWDNPEWTNIQNSDSSTPQVQRSANDLVYLIYTSGSTGKPKGVKITHGNVYSFFVALNNRFSGSQNQVWLAVTSIGFDISFLELFWPLYNGHQVVIMPDIYTSASASSNLDFSLFYFAAQDEKPNQDKYELLLKGAKFSDLNGLSAIWIPERHFHSFGDQFPNPSVAAAAVAVTTSKIKIRSGSVVLPLHDPVRVAEEWSMVDHFSKGRVEMSFASGWHPNDFIFAPEDFGDRFDKMRQKISRLKSLWNGIPEKRINGIGKIVDITIHPTPLQKDLQIWITAAGSIKTFEYAGSIGANILTHLLGQSDEEIRDKIDSYRKSLKEHGFDPTEKKVALMLHTYVSDDYSKVKDTVREPFKNYLRHSIDLIKPLAEEAGFDINNDVELLVEFGFNRFFGTRGLFGTPELCLPYVQRLGTLGIDEIACLIDFGIENELVLQHLPFIAQLKDMSLRSNAQKEFLRKRLTKITSIQDTIDQFQITHIQCTPTFANELLTSFTSKSALSKVKTILVGGEVLPQQLAAKLVGAGLNVYNMYGPTETTIWSTCKEIRINDKITIGKPLSNTSVYILDENKKPLPTGVSGNLFISGEGVSSGYWNRVSLTEERFLANPFKPGEILYATGDIARWLENGEIEFLGRVDDQVKLRGHRIELQEIENTLLEFSGVTQSAVVLREDTTAHKHLLAYVTGTDLNAEKILDLVRARLPMYMVPSRVILMERLPLTPNGKVDKKALPSEFQSQSHSSFFAPRNEVELKLCNLMQDLLQIDKVGIYDNFFEIGGDSIITIQVVSQAKKLGYSLVPRNIFEYQTVAALATVVGNKSRDNIAAEQGILFGEAPLLPIQKWFFNGQKKDYSHYNQCALLRIPKHIGQDVLQAVIIKLVDHHDALRFTYERLDLQNWKQFYSGVNQKMEFYNIELINDDKAADEITCICEFTQQSLDIEKGILIKSAFIKTSQSDPFNRLLIVVHHLAIDGVSWRILMDDFQHALVSVLGGNKIDLGLKTTSYREWAKALVSYAQTEQLLSQRKYWDKICARFTPLPTDMKSDETTYAFAKTHTTTLSFPLTKLLLSESNAAYHTGINDLLLCALMKTISTWTKMSACVIGLEGHGRESNDNSIDTTRSIGWFTSLYPIALDIQGIEATSDLIKTVKEQLRSIPDKGLGYGLLNYLTPETTEVPLSWDISFNYLGQFDSTILPTSGILTAPESVGKAFSDSAPINGKISIVASVSEGQLDCHWTYSTRQYFGETIERISNQYLTDLTHLIQHCSNKTHNEYTPFDWGLSPEITVSELDYYLKGDDNGKINKDNIEIISRLSPLQEGILFHILYDQGEHAYTQQFLFDINFEINVPHFELAWNKLIEKHSIFRTSFLHNEFKIPVQCTHYTSAININELDYAHLDEEEQARRLTQFLKDDLARGVNLINPPLMRISLIQLEPSKYKLVWTYSHILIDGWSLPIVLSELVSLYKALLEGEHDIDNHKDNYFEFIRFLDRKRKYSDQDFWKKYLSDVNGQTLLPFVKQEAKRNRGGVNHKTIKLEFDPKVSDQVRYLAQVAHTTVNNIIQGVWAILLSKYLGKEEIVFGITVSGRSSEFDNAENRVGLFMNTIPLYTKVNKEKPVINWFTVLQESFTSIQGHEHSGLVDICKWTGLPFDLFDTILVFENYPTSILNDVFSEKSLVESEQMSMVELTNYPLTVDASMGTELTITFNFYESLINGTYVEGIKSHFETLLLAVIQAPNTLIKDLEFMSDKEKYLLEYGFNDTDCEYPRQQTITSLFEEQVNRTPEKTAIICGDKSITYEELNSKANVVALHLKQAGTMHGEVIPVIMERSIDLAICVFAIWKSGGAYLLIDPQLPSDRIAFMLDETSASKILCDKQLDTLLYSQGRQIISILSIVQIDPLIYNPTPILNSRDLAFVNFTSGSTGFPKAILIEHRSKVNHLDALIKSYTINEHSVIAQTASQSFDIFLWQMITALLVGGQTVIYSKETQMDLHQFTKSIQRDKVTILQHVPDFLSTWFDFLGEFRVSFPSLQYLVASGEEIKSNVVKKWFAMYDRVPMVNAYGPAEASDDVSLYFINSLPDADVIPIGRPLQNVKIYIISDSRTLCPIGIAGEIAIGGECLSRGYSRDEFNEARFIKSPFNSKERLYLTGDVGKYLPDGNLVFYGRNDSQIKIRGYRIELSEIENVLLTSEKIKKCVVIADENGAQEKSIIAYVVGKENYEKTAVLNFLMSHLPQYMIPSQIIELTDFPVTANGKVDKKALPKFPFEVASEIFVYENEMESEMANIWSSILGLEDNIVGRESNFFSLGANSLHATRLVAEVRRKYQLDLPIRQIFDNPMICTFTAAVRQMTNTTDIPISKIEPRPEKIPMSFSQERVWLIDRMRNTSNYHMFMVFRLTGYLNVEILMEALKTVVDRHEILRTVLNDDPVGIGFQKVLINNWTMDFVDLESVSAQVDIIYEYVKNEIAKPFDLANDFMLRAQLVNISSDSHLLLMTMHHVAIDGWSESILMNELVELYDAKIHKRESFLPLLPVQYADYAIWQRSVLSEALLRQKLDYWVKKLKDFSPLDLRTIYPRGAELSTEGRIVSLDLEYELKTKLIKLANNEKVTIFILMLAAFKVLLHRYTLQEDVCVGTPVANRTRKEVENLIGFFVNTLPLRTNFNNLPQKVNSTFLELMSAVRDTTLEAFDNQQVPFEKIVEATGQTKTLSRSPIFDVMFVSLNSELTLSKSTSGLRIEEYPIEASISKFDLVVGIEETKSGFRIGAEYCTKLFSARFIDSMLKHFRELLCSIVDNPNTRISRLNILTREERTQLEHNIKNQMVLAVPPKFFPEDIKDHKGFYSVLGNDGEFLPEGVIGHLYIGGSGVSRGYLNEVELTYDRFITDPLFGDGSRLYNTGDLARWLPDGTIEYIGRQDEQVKIRGYRIELGEISKVIESYPSVRQSVVVCTENEKGISRLLAYVLCSENPMDVKELEEFVQRRLPDYMVPTLWQLVDHFDLTANGKIDKSQLPLVENELKAGLFLEARNKVEEDLVGIWRGLLDHSPIGVMDNFFEIGGDSIITIQIVSRARQKGYKLSPRDVFEHQTISELAEVAIKNEERSIQGEQGYLSGESPLLPIQHEFFEYARFGSSHFNQSVLLEISKEIQPSDIEEAMRVLIEYHDALRFQYVKEGEGWRQYYGSGSLHMEAIELNPREASQWDEACTGYQQSLNIERGDVFRVVFIKTPQPQERNRLLLIAHHLVIDGVSWRILLDHLDTLLTGLSKGETVRLGSKGTSYREWATWLQGYAQSPQVESQLTYWEQIVSNHRPLGLIQDRTKDVRYRDMSNYTLTLDRETTTALLDGVHHAYHTEINDILISAVAKSICQLTNESRVVIGLKRHGRQNSEEVDTSNTIGWFTITFPVSLQLQVSRSDEYLIQTVKEQLRNVPDKGMGFGALRYLHPNADIRNKLTHYKFDIVFNYLGQLDHILNDQSMINNSIEKTGDEIGEFIHSEFRIEITSYIMNNELCTSVAYAAKGEESNEIEALAKAYYSNLKTLVTHCRTKEFGVLTASDFRLAVEQIKQSEKTEVMDGDEIIII